jgi:hypothetical protein
MTGSNNAHQRKTIFISYSRRDLPYVAQLSLALANEFDVVVDFTAVAPGDEWPAILEESIRRADFVLVVISKSSMKSEQVAVEGRNAYQHGLRIIPLVLEACTTPEFLARLHWIDARCSFEKTTARLKAALSGIALSELPPPRLPPEIPVFRWFFPPVAMKGFPAPPVNRVVHFATTVTVGIKLCLVVFAFASENAALAMLFLIGGLLQLWHATCVLDRKYPLWDDAGLFGSTSALVILPLGLWVFRDNPPFPVAWCLYFLVAWDSVLIAFKLFSKTYRRWLPAFRDSVI